LLEEARLKSEEQVCKELKETEILLETIAFQRGEIDYELRNRYKNRIEVLMWILED